VRLEGIEPPALRSGGVAQDGASVPVNSLVVVDSSHLGDNGGVPRLLGALLGTAPHVLPFLPAAAKIVESTGDVGRDRFQA
jgi:hypothetical protein